MSESVASGPERVGAGDLGVEGELPRRPRWAVLGIVVPLFVVAGLLFTGGTRLERSVEPLAGFEIVSTTTTIGFAADLTAGWSFAQVGIWGTFVDVTVFDGGLLAVEQSPEGSHLWSSPNGGRWEPVDDPDGVFAGAWIEDIEATDFGLVAVGARMQSAGWRLPAAWQSTDGVTWVPASMIAVSQQAELFGEVDEGSITTVMRSSDGLLIAGGAANGGAAIWHSADDGASWELTLREGLISEILEIAETGGGFLAVGDLTLRPGLWESNDGLNWERANTSPLDAPGPFEYPWELLEVGDRWLAVGGDRHDRSQMDEAGRIRRPPVVWSSLDTIEWNRDLIDELVGVRFVSVLEAGPGLIAAGTKTSGDDSRAGLWWSHGGLEWDGVLLDGDPGATQQVNGMTVLGERVVVVGQNGAGPAVWMWDPDGPVSVATSVELPYVGRWVDRGLVAEQRLWPIHQVTEGFVAVSEQSVWHSANGVDWDELTFEQAGLDEVEVIHEITGDRAPYFASGMSVGEEWTWTILRSDDGRIWTRTWQAEDAWRSGRIASNGERLARVNEDGFLGYGFDFAASKDGVDWHEIELPPVEGFISALGGFKGDFFVVMVADSAVPSLWRIGADDGWTAVPGLDLGDGWSQFFASGDVYYLLVGCCGEQKLYATTDGRQWDPLDLPTVGVDFGIDVRPLANGLFMSARWWSGEEEWPVRHWFSLDGVTWSELPPIGAARFWDIVPLPGSDRMAVFEIGETGTRFWEWEPTDE
ncbi:MAG: hypothetical protein P1T08_15560 [Acidimicrobiia bacterium]|nr:hypothetical protein [Acidimicrobiia bacterium]